MGIESFHLNKKVQHQGFKMIRVLALLLLAVTVQSSTRSDLTLPRDCGEIANSGVHTIYTPFGGPVQAYCDGKWTVIQRRMDGSVGFTRNWAAYKAGFGAASGEYWLGLENMHLLTEHKKYELKVDMEDFAGIKDSVYYSTFSVGSEATGYTLHITGYKGKGENSLGYHNGQKF